MIANISVLKQFKPIKPVFHFFNKKILKIHTTGVAIAILTEEGEVMFMENGAISQLESKIIK